MAATDHSQAIKQDSKDYLTTALLQLLEKNTYSTITVSQVVRRAGVSRMAFYRNFDKLDDVLLQYFSSIISTRFADINQHVPANKKLQSLEIFFRDFAKTLEMSVIWREWLMNNQGESLDMIHQLLATLQTSTVTALKNQQAD